MNNQPCIDKLTDWIESYGYIIDFYGDDNCICSLSKVIEIDASQLDKEIILYTLMHEAGHILVFNNPGQLKLLNPSLRQSPLSKEEKILVLLEEIEAWKRGKNLGKRLGLLVDEKKLESERAEALFKYIKWSLE
jgi:hypothetical protein